LRPTHPPSSAGTRNLWQRPGRVSQGGRLRRRDPPGPTCGHADQLKRSARRSRGKSRWSAGVLRRRFCSPTPVPLRLLFTLRGGGRSGRHPHTQGRGYPRGSTVRCAMKSSAGGEIARKYFIPYAYAERNAATRHETNAHLNRHHVRFLVLGRRLMKTQRGLARQPLPRMHQSSTLSSPYKEFSNLAILGEPLHPATG